MKKNLIITLCCFWALSSSHAQNNNEINHVVLISIDGLRPEFYLDETWPAPNIQHLAKHGIAASGVNGVFPTATYASHTSIISGQLPVNHGIFYNMDLDLQNYSSKWFMEYKDVKTKTLWEKIKEKNMTSAAFSWPVTAGAPIDYNIPEVWTSEAPSDRTVAIRKWDNPANLLEELEEYATGKLEGDDISLSYRVMDQNHSRMMGYVIRKYKPNLSTIHLVHTDGAQHKKGRDSELIRQTLASVDQAVGHIIESIDRAGIADQTVVMVIGDHGFVDIHHLIQPNVLLAEMGLLGNEINRNDWKGFFQSSSGSTFLHLKDKNDTRLLNQIISSLDKLPKEIRAGFEILDKEQLKQAGAHPDAVLALAANEGYKFGASWTEELFSESSGGIHGNYPNFKNIQTGMIIYGKQIKAFETPVDNVNLIDFAPIIADLLQLDSSGFDGAIPPVLKNNLFKD
ncbi:ectonucleotide pyrophosphatase/phosphodiesterase [Belliella sp. DSM 111904]|uniref:Ectonucleotide pyrophosphatase/phosphodiesterase n=1 Tax=Belliella filtrata TaxID=2923435 RepID=A0ABS9V6H5_9BACT|nr:ectonucleotide pyrophosphatase/phosphodiesterase [Belliella filtrata]MCH7411550.1 ectonucleotide pyrophosphatase/phosphodiesterase [Belliella filtrata]